MKNSLNKNILERNFPIPKVRGVVRYIKWVNFGHFLDKHLGNFVSNLTKKRHIPCPVELYHPKANSTSKTSEVDPGNQIGESAGSYL